MDIMTKGPYGATEGALLANNMQQKTKGVTQQTK
jgi:hypothetical protein